ncbi:MAG: acyl-CoA dehydrogenase [Rhodospirillaceae bacterium]|nr:acyl-CoA dehydrogenase [Rhodospirillaceae bacterium]MYH36029.1 acyl-CoA dehydrogenase [Rhodospirillaceae bacterium]MYK14091.1 acyl-CoA dehydrogenase [Rhodospirillaceae bacterium]MYK60031.1 acyl-CoA dehydrogenase [Rhodospirillaceae bacterium]
MPTDLPRTLFSPDHEIFRASVQAFLEAEVVPHYADWEEAGYTPRDVWLRAGEMGLLGTGIPEEYGGSGGDFLWDAIVIEELGRYGLAAPAWDMHGHIIAPIIAAHGTDEQKRRILPAMAAGESIFCIGLTEPGGGSDLAALRTGATESGNGFLVNGSKIFITNGHIADYILLAANRHPDRGAKGISLFLVPLDSDGVTRGRNLKKIGNKAQDTAELFFDDVRLPGSALLGASEQGWSQLMHGLARERMVTAVRSMAIAEVALEQTVAYTKDRTAFGQRVFDFQNTQFKLAELATACTAMRPFVDRLIRLLAADELSAELAAMAKLAATELADRVLDECLQLHGGHGYMWDTPIARAWADARVHRIYAGTNEIMKYIIGRSL